MRHDDRNVLYLLLEGGGEEKFHNLCESFDKTGKSKEKRRKKLKQSSLSKHLCVPCKAGINR